MKKTSEDNNYIYFLDFFQGDPVRIMQDKKTAEILFNADDVIKILGLGSNITDFLSTDEGLDTINKFKQEHPNEDIFGKKGMFRRVGE